MMPRVLMVAAENDALPPVRTVAGVTSAKVGGIGDVVRDVPPALAARGCAVSVVTPAYGVFARAPGARRVATLKVAFAGTTDTVDVYEVPGRHPVAGVRLLVLDHALFSDCGAGRIYCDDPPGRPFARDATKFALFCAAVAEGIIAGVLGDPDVIHLHDWHAALLLVLRRFDLRYRRLARARCVYTIHNLALQGIRPLAGDESSLDSWFPALRYDPALLADPRWADCINPAAVGVRLGDAVHAVSPSYAEEIMRPSAVSERGFFGGEGLEDDLRSAQQQGRLFGILNGCEYPPPAAAGSDGWPELLARMRAEVLAWAGGETQLSSVHFLAHERLARLGSTRPGLLLTSVGRITDQKLRLLRQPASDGRPALKNLLLGSGDPDYEQFLTATAAGNANFVYLRGYSEPVSRALYAQGDLFLMPSSFEPCGISQMLAMRAGQPCLVHGVGGLKDTVEDGVTGFAFGGDSVVEQADNLVAALRRALAVHRDQPTRWAAMRQAAAARRFEWGDSIDGYLTQLYLTQLNAPPSGQSAA